MFKYLQRTGKALMLPIAALPIAGILLGIGGAFLGISGMTDAPAIYQSIANGINNSAFLTALLTIMKYCFRKLTNFIRCWGRSWFS